MTRGLWLVGGGAALGAGLVGLVLPLIPTVPFLLLAAFCFARSSARLHDWLVTHPTLGPPIRDWERSGAISPRAKRLGTVSVLVGFGLSVWLEVPPPVLILQALVLGAVLVFIWTRPSR